jgi:hypothetical protein
MTVCNVYKPGGGIVGKPTPYCQADAMALFADWAKSGGRLQAWLAGVVGYDVRFLEVE